VLVCLLLVYSSCRKSDNNPAPTRAQSFDAAVFAGQIAKNLATNLTGTYGGVNLAKSSSSLSYTSHGLQLSSNNSSALCGLFTDSTVNYSYADTTNGTPANWHWTGNITFSFNCQNGKSSGYTAYDSTNMVRTAGLEVDTYNIKQYYVIQCLDDQHIFTGVSGDIYFYMTAAYATTKPDVANANYVLNNLKINTSNRDVVSGTATFVATGAYGNARGTITYLGNYTASVTLSTGQTFQIDLNNSY
jgi:hypothetical protein